MESTENKYKEMVWEKFKKGDSWAFDVLYRTHIDALFAYGMKICYRKDLVEDAIQDVFVDLYRYSSTLSTPNSLKFYLYKCLRTSILRKIKEEKKLDYTEELSDSGILKFSIEELPESEDLEENLTFLKKEVAQLDVQKKELLFLRFHSGLSFPEIAELLEIKPDTAKKQVQRLLKMLQKRVKQSPIILWLISLR